VKNKSDKLIIVPAYNEQGNIERVIADIRENAPGWDYIIVNDCSTDDTLEVCRRNHFKYLNFPVNLGIGGAVQAGYRYAFYHGYSYAVQFDGDGQHNAAYIPELFRTMEKTKASMVIGSRFIQNEGFQSSKLRRVGIRYFTWLIKLLTKVTVTDPTSGFRLVNKRLMKEFVDDYPKDYPEPESTVAAIERNYTVYELPVVMNERLSGKSSISLGKSAYYMIKVSFAIIIAKIKN